MEYRLAKGTAFDANYLNMTCKFLLVQQLCPKKLRLGHSQCLLDEYKNYQSRWEVHEHRRRKQCTKLFVDSRETLKCIEINS